MPPTVAARRVTLEGFGDSKCLRVRMRREENGWSAKVRLGAGWFFYRFIVDGKSKWDRDAGKCKTQVGRACSVALIQGVKSQKGPIVEEKTPEIFYEI